RLQSNQAQSGKVPKRKPGHRAGLPTVTLSPNSLRANQIDETNGKAWPEVKSTWVALNTGGGTAQLVMGSLPITVMASPITGSPQTEPEAPVCPPSPGLLL